MQCQNCVAAEDSRLVEVKGKEREEEDSERYQN